MISTTGATFWAALALWMQMSAVPQPEMPAPPPETPAQMPNAKDEAPVAGEGTADAETGERRARAQILLAQCQFRFGKRDFRQARALCADALALEANLATARVWMARALWELGEREKAASEMEEALQALPEDARLLGQLGIWQLHLDNVVWAARNLRRALELDLQNETVRLACVTAYLEAGEWKEAATLAAPLFNSADATVRARAHLAAGIAALRMGDRTLARRHLRRSHTREAAAQLQALTRGERGWERGLFFQFKLGLGADTNPSYSQETDTARARTTAGCLTQPMRLSWVPRQDVKLEGALSYQYFFAPWNGENHERVIAFSHLSAETAASKRWFLSSWPWPAHVETSAFWASIGLLGGAGIPAENEPFVFMEKGSLGAELAAQTASGREAALGFTLSRTAYRDSDRDGFSGLLFIRHSWFLRRNTLKFFSQAFSGAHNARWAAWNHVSGGIWAGFSSLLPARFELALTGSVEVRLYPQSANEASKGQNPWNLNDGENRRDAGGFASAVLSRALDTGGLWRWELVVRRQFMHSNAEAFSFSRWSVLLQLSGDISRR